MNLASLKLRCRDPQSLRQVEFLPDIPFVWLNQGPIELPAGFNLLGSEAQRPITDPKEYVLFGLRCPGSVPAFRPR